MRILTVSSIGALVLTLGCAGPEAPAENAAAETSAESARPETTAEYPDAVTADPEHYSVEFENDAVRLLRIAYGPGETSAMHHHPANCSIALSPGSWQMTGPDGTVTEDTAALGDVGCEEATVHLPQNTRSEASELILVELKEGATAGSSWAPQQPDAVTADPEHYSVEFENDAVRLVRVRYGAGETSVMHHHPAGCVIPVRDQPVRFELLSGEVIEVVPESETGQVTCDDAEVHLPTNTGDGEIDIVLVELKGRETVGG